MARFWSYLDNNRVHGYFKVSQGKINIHVEGLNYFNYVVYGLQHVIFIKLMSKQVHNKQLRLIDLFCVQIYIYIWNLTEDYIMMV